ncbi:MAG: chemotaxis protein [Betaproteobacteria bacterium HGW-Betaproteobacteria-7]|jgi:methyl-accepting chemotaxis protein|nr:MAG: chemotaxis protein [Betaproteobacteria bacterium HGW-Betaproteobacteria-7]
MKNNQPVTDKEVLLKPATLIVSKTDLKGCITYVNRDFQEISGFSEAELIGQSHNIVRHPDMPVEAFVDLWQTLGQHRPWTGFVKNRCKNGDYYWVRANVTPIWEDGQVTGYMSVRRLVEPEITRQLADVYRQFREQRQGSLRILRGSVVRGGEGMAGSLRDMSAATAVNLIALLVVSVLLLLGFAGARLGAAAPVLAVLVAVFAFLALQRTMAGVLRPLGTVTDTFRLIAAGEYDNRFDFNRDDEVGKVLQAMQSMQIKLGCDVAEARRVSEENLRIRIGLDNAATNVMIVDDGLNIIYMNRAIHEMFAVAENDIRQDLPAFSRRTLIGTNIDVFHSHPAQQRQMLAALVGTHRATIKLGGRTFSLAMTPVSNEGGLRLGYAVEWLDRTAEVAVEDEVAEIVAAAARGDFSRRVDEAGKHGFFLRLAGDLNRLLEISQHGLNDIAHVLGAMAEGDLTKSIVAEYDGTFGQLKDDANTTVARLQEIVEQIKQATDAINTAAQEIAAGNQDLSSRTEEQASSLEETASSMEQLTSTVRQNAENSRQASELAVNAQAVAIKGGEVVGEVVHTMNAIHQASSRIADIIGVIDGIAFQTNILALNAAVEAARAGEQGRGFAVVASEVRNLAQRSAAAAKEIKELISDSVSKVEAGNKQVDQAGRTMQEVVASIRRVAAIMTEISAASREQSAGIDLVCLAVNQMDDVTQQNAALVEQAAAAAESLEEQAHSLAQAVSVFHVGNERRGAVAARRQLPRPEAKSVPAAQRLAGQKIPPPLALRLDDEWEEF